MQKKIINQILKKLRTTLPNIPEQAKIDQIIVGKDPSMVITSFEYEMVPLGKLRGRYEGYEIISTSNSFCFKKEKKSNLRHLAGLVFYLIFGVFVSLILNIKIFKIVYKYINLSIFSPIVYDIQTGSFFINRVLFFLVGIFLWVMTPYLISNIVLDALKYDKGKYNWKKLYDSLKIEGYAPDKFEDGYIRVKKINDSYYVTNGNHRHGILLQQHKKDYAVKVKIFSPPTTIKLSL